MRRDRGEGVPVPLAPRGRQESARHRREVEVSLDHGDTEDSDDQLSGNDEETGNDMSTLYNDIICRPFIHTYMVLLRCCSQSCKLAAETQGYMLLSLFPRPNITTHTFRPEPQGLTTAMIACIACCKSIASCSSWGGRRLGCILVFRT